MKNSIELTNNEMIVVAALIELLYAEPGFSDAGVEDLAAFTKKSKASVKGTVGSLTKKGVFVEEPEDFPGIVYLHPDFYSYHPVWHTEADSRKQKDLLVAGKEVKRVPVKKAKAAPKKAKATTKKEIQKVGEELGVLPKKKAKKADEKKAAKKDKKAAKKAKRELVFNSKENKAVKAGVKVTFKLHAKRGGGTATGTVHHIHIRKDNKEYVLIETKAGLVSKRTPALTVKK